MRSAASKSFRTFLLAAAAFAAQAAPLGERPAYLQGEPSAIPNEQALRKSIWAPGLDEGYVPQGLAYGDGMVFVAAYKSTDPKVDKGPCRVFVLAAADGAPKGQFDLPDDCGHAGGIAVVDAGTLVVADTRMLYKIDVARALAAGTASAGLRGTVKLAGRLKGSCADFDGKDLWVGSAEGEAGKSRAHRLSLAVFDTADGKALREDAALSSIPIPINANGMAFDGSGKLWIASSNSKFGALYRLDPADGAILAKYDMAIGLEDLGFDEEGALWTVSEAGSRRWSRWSKTYPLVLRFDPAALK